MHGSSTMREWIEGELWDDVYFRPDRLGPKTVIYVASFSFPLVKVLIDGYAASAPWSADEFFDRLRPLAERHPCAWIYITNTDGAIDYFRWEQPCNPDWFASERLNAFEATPGEEGGPCRLVLAFQDRRGMLVFTYDPARAFEIAFYGRAERLGEIRERI